MVITFDKEYLRELYQNGKTTDKKYRFQPQIVKKFTRVVNLMIEVRDVQQLAQYGGLHYEHLHNDKQGISSVRVNDQYRIEFKEELQEGQSIATICNITELSNHYK